MQVYYELNKTNGPYSSQRFMELGEAAYQLLKILYKKDPTWIAGKKRMTLIGSAIYASAKMKGWEIVTNRIIEWALDVTEQTLRQTNRKVAKILGIPKRRNGLRTIIAWPRK